MGFNNIDATPPYQREEYREQLRETILYGYVMTAFFTTLIYFIDTLFQSTGFFIFIWHIIKGVFVGGLSGVFWPILLLFDMENAWAIWFSFLLSAIILYRWKYYREAYQKYFYGFAGVYGVATLVLILRYIDLH